MEQPLQVMLRLWEQLPTGSLKYSGLWFMFCVFLHMVVGFGTPEILTDFASKMKARTERQEWYNRAVSIVHASIMFSRTAVYWLLLNPKIALPIAGVKADRYKGFDAITIDIMMGYLWYDILIELTKGRRMGKTTLLHHLVGYVSLLCTRATHSQLGVFYFMLVFVAEGSTPVLHTLWLLHKLECTQWLVYNLLAGLLLVLFFLLRVVLGPYTIYHLVEHRAVWDREKDGQWMHTLLLTISIVFVSINYYWFYLLLRMAMKSSVVVAKEKVKEM